ncbi:Isopentenyl-diphosphate Delta-isomerase [bioreactor metagenome]|uniref:Isopentenyl-diphosphate Delta-isomerase n=1 Tax=bioreactor metagenome TaxID=1076179 RepID=A0A645HGD4_9ZZZZ
MKELWDILDENGNKTGRLCERGTRMYKGEYHLVVQVWIKNSNNEFLISRRSNNGISWSGLWQTTGGAAVAGDNSLKTALKETREEIGIMLDPKNGQLFKHYSEPRKNDSGGVFIDVWLFRQDFDISTVVLQPEETCDAMWASSEKIKQMIYDGYFIPPQEAYPYIDEILINNQ